MKLERLNMCVNHAIVRESLKSTVIDSQMV